MLHLDFESRSKADIWEAGAWNYSTDPSTEILCIAYAIDDGPVILIPFIEGFSNEDVYPLIDAIKKGELFYAYNALFEQCIWQNILVKKYGWPRIPIKQWRCVMAKALACSLPRSLAECGKALNAPIQKSKDGERVMLKLARPNSKGGWNEDPKDFQILYDYCVQDVEAERCVDNMLPDLIPSEQNIWFLDQLINQRGIYVDIEAIDKSLSFIETFTENLNGVVADVSDGKLDGVSRRMAVLQWCKDQGVAIEGYTKGDVRSVLQKDLPDSVRFVLNAKLQLGRSSVKKFKAMRESADMGNRIRDLFIYHGASTGRWAGKLIQLHNLPKGNLIDPELAIKDLKRYDLETFESLYPDVMGTLSGCIRGMIIASPGKDLLISDYNAIETRVLMWLAEDQLGLKQFKEGVDLYVEMAKRIFQKSNISREERNLGKATVLGCGYGMGAAKFYKTCLQWGISISEGLAKVAVDTYRSTYPNVCALWYSQENGAIESLTRPQKSGRIHYRFIKDRNVLSVVLPSGRSLIYNSPSADYVETPWKEQKLALHFYGLKKIEGQTTTKWEKQSTYGGKIVENLVQAISRDILAGAMFALESCNYPVLFSVHDEIVSEVPENFGSTEEFEKIMCDLPKWAYGCPIAAEAIRCKRYKK